MHWTTAAPRTAARVVRSASGGPDAERRTDAYEQLAGRERLQEELGGPVVDVATAKDGDPMPAALDEPLDQGANSGLVLDDRDHRCCDAGRDGPVLRLRRADHV